MEITFDIQNFVGRAKNLTNVLYYLSRSNCFTPHLNEEIEEITCRTPSDALRYVRHVNGKIGISPNKEVVFLKNPGLGMRYLRYINRDRFVDNKTQTRFWKKVAKKPELCLEWSRTFNKRVSEEEEEVFVKSLRCMKEYALHIIKGPFPERIHQMIVLKSFDSSVSEWEKKCLKEYVSYVEKNFVK